MSILLLLGAVQGAVVAVGLLQRKTNRQANFLLSGLVLILTLKLVPYIIGYAGFYMVYPWLDLAPFDLALGIGPLLYLYLSRLTHPRLPSGWWLHLVPVAVQFLLYLVMFDQPMSFKNWFEDHPGPVFNVIENSLEAISMSVYVGLAWRVYSDYDGWLKNRFGDPDAHRLRFLKTGLFLLSATLLSFVGAKVWGLVVHPVSYFQMFPFYALLTLVVYAFGFTAFQFSDLEFPNVGEAEPSKEITKETDWTSVAAQFTSKMQASTFWTDPLLSIAATARALETSEGRLSKAINLGLNVSFSEWINQYRIEQVAIRLAGAEPEGSAGEKETMLAIAFECGFNSKATFNRWFRAVKGCTPTEFRERCARGEGPAPEPHPFQQQSS
jgi:AraC-like DNA-binding protein